MHRNIYGSLVAVQKTVSKEISQYVDETRQLLFVYSNDHQKLQYLTDDTQSDQYLVLQLNQIKQTLGIDIALLQQTNNKVLRSSLTITLTPSLVQQIFELSQTNNHFFMFLNNQVFMFFPSSAEQITTNKNPGSLSLILGKAINSKWLRKLSDESGLNLSLSVDTASFSPISSIKAFNYSPQQLEAWTVSNNYLALFNPAVLFGIQRLYTLELELMPLPGPKASLFLSINAERVSENFIKLQLTIAALALMTVFIAGLLGYFTARRISRPMAELGLYADKIAQGQYQEAFELRAYSKEFAQLMGAFNEMQNGISEREKDILHQAEHDMLTGLPNRRNVKSLLENKFELGESFSLVIINVIDFRHINDMFGNDLGDNCLCIMANRISKLGGYAARLTGGKFLWLPTNKSDLRQLREIRKELSSEILTQGISININVALGTLDCPKDANSIESLFRRLTVLVEASKMAESNTINFAPFLEQHYLRRLEILTQLTHAIEQHTDQLSMVYQPIQDIRTGKTTKLEALLRWQHPNLGNVPPDEFIQIAESSGLINKLSKWIIDQVLADKVWFAGQGFELNIAINISPVDITSSSLLPYLNEKLSFYGVSSKAITLELTESVLANDKDKAFKQLTKLHCAGFDIAIDDFGTGYSSLSYLASFPANILKIDRSFVSDISQSKEHNLICKRVIQIAQDLNLQVVAEGVEDKESLDILSAFGCQFAQGYYIARPSDKQTIVSWLTHQ